MRDIIAIEEELFRKKGKKHIKRMKTLPFSLPVRRIFGEGTKSSGKE